MPSARKFDRSTDDVGNIIGLEHVNVTVPDQTEASLFYVTGMGFTRDPYIDFGTFNTWFNLGSQQFHTPVNKPQVWTGRIGIVVPSLDGLRARLARITKRFANTQFRVTDKKSHLEVTCPWGNRLICHEAGSQWGGMALGMPYVEIDVAPKSAKGIAAFYNKVMRAPAKTTTTGKKGKKLDVAEVSIGQQQTIRFCETKRDLPEYDGHHLAIYVTDFSGPHKWLDKRGLVFEESDAHQYRFRDIVNPRSGKKLVTIEHEVRSLFHPMYARNLVNRNAEQSFFSYRRGHDAFVG